MSDAAPALGFSIVANLGNDRQITTQCFVGVDEDTATIHARIDKVQDVIDRQRARYEIKDLEAEREKHAVNLARAEDDLSRIEQEYLTGQSQFDVQIGYLGEQIRAVDDAANARGRSFPVGGDASRKKAMQAEQKELVEAKAKATAERDQFRQNVAISIVRFREEIEKLDAKLAGCRALIGE